MQLKKTEFIIAEQSLGAHPAKIIWRHIMPNVIGPLLILAAMDVPVVVTVEAGLSFLGLGVLPPTASWGSILNEGYLIIRDAPWLVIAGGIPLILTTRLRKVARIQPMAVGTTAGQSHLVVQVMEMVMEVMTHHQSQLWAALPRARTCS